MPIHQLPTDPSDEELARDWNLSADDLTEVRRCRGDANRHHFAIQLCALRSLGCFVNDVGDVPVRIVNHVGRQLGLSPALFLAPLERPATATDHTQRIRQYLGYQPFDDRVQERLGRFLGQRAVEGILAGSLFTLAVDALRAWMVELPAQSTLERLVASCAAHGEEAMWRRIQERLSPEFCTTVDTLLTVPNGDRHSPLQGFKLYPPSARTADILSYLDRFSSLCAMPAGHLDLAGLGTEFVEHFAELVRRYDVDDLRRFVPAKRHALVACFLAEARKTTLDHLVEMHREFLTGMSRRARHAVEARHRQVRQQVTKAIATVLHAMNILLDQRTPREARLEKFYEEHDEEALRAAVDTCREFHALGDYGQFDELLARHSHLKRYLPGFLTLPFCGEPGMEPLLAAIEFGRRLHSETPPPRSETTPTQFAAGAWRAVLTSRPTDHRLWELALAFAMRDALRAGDLYLAESRHHVSFWNLVHHPAEWEEKRGAAYRELNLPTDAERAIDRLRADLEQAARDLARGLDANPFASLRDGRLEYTRLHSAEECGSVGELRRVIETHLPRVRIEDLLLDVDSWCGFTRAFTPLAGIRSQAEKPYATLLAALVAHGTNLGIATMAQSTDGMSVDALNHVSRWFLRQDTLRAANTSLVNYHHRLPLASVWGEGIASSSDGQRFGIQAPSLMASFYPRYFGYYDRAVTVYTHVSDQFAAFASRVISCSPREAIYVLDGLLENNTILRPREHSTDTHGFTEQLFGLCYLLGYSFMPRLKDLKDQQLYRVDRSTSFGVLNAVFRGTIDVGLVVEQWDQLVRLVSSLRSRTAPAHVVLERLAASSDRLAKALSMLGRVVKSAYILRYAHDAALRDRIQLQLNRGESRHALARRVFFANQGAFRVGDYEEIMNKVSALALLSNAALAWNTVRIGEIVASLERSGGQPVRREDLARISPLANAHIIPSGTYHFRRAAIGVTPLE
jgi:TnpA family transposase